MGDVKEFLKKYWPYLVGAVVGLYIIVRFSGGSSSGSSGGGSYNLQAQDGGANAALQAQINASVAANALEQKRIDAQIAFDQKDLDIKQAAVYSDAFNEFQKSQAAMAGSLGSSTSGILNSLFAPSITAMAAGAAENAAALEAAGNVAAQSFQSQGDIVGASAKAMATVSDIIGRVTANATQPEQKTDWAGIINAGANAYSAYATGGMMNNTPQGGGSVAGGGGRNPYGSGYGGAWGF